MESTSKKVVLPPLVLGLVAPRGSGKDLVYKIIEAYLSPSMPVFRYSFGDEVKREFCRLTRGSLLCIEENKSIPEIRIPLQIIGQSRREADPDFWIRKLSAKFPPKLGNYVVVITDLRYQSDAAWVRKFPRSHIIRVDRPAGRPPYDPIIDEHLSETGQYFITHDYLLHNPGTSIASLRVNVAELLRNLNENLTVPLHRDVEL